MKTTGKQKPARPGKPSSTRKTTSKKKAKSKIILTSLAVGAVGILGYLAWQFYTKRRASKRASANYMTILPGATSAAIYPNAANTSSGNSSASVPLPKPVTQTTTANKTSSTLSSFPLKKGSKNELVKSLQLALIAKYGPVFCQNMGPMEILVRKLSPRLRRLYFPQLLMKPPIM
jgi:hypothetical protein